MLGVGAESHRLIDDDDRIVRQVVWESALLRIQEREIVIRARHDVERVEPVEVRAHFRLESFRFRVLVRPPEPGELLIQGALNLRQRPREHA